ncbi:MAG: Holliday junction branch migration DNA helicase RuvB [Puniceicoccaceae bacterium]
MSKLEKISAVNRKSAPPYSVAVVERSLRPQSFGDFTGQRRSIERLKVMVGAAKSRQEAMSHILLSGPPGLGKTTLAHVMGRELGVNVKVTSGPVIEKPADMAGLLTSLELKDILFIDEIHRIPKSVEEYLYSAMEDFVIDIMIDQGPNARSVRLSLQPFTLIGATTREGMLTAPLRSRFTLKSRLSYYTREELTEILLRSADVLGIAIDRQGAIELAARARGTARIANNLLQFTRDYAQQKASNRIDREVARSALELLEIDAHGLDEIDKQLLWTVAVHYKGGPVGIRALAVAVGEDATTLEEVHEPYLIQEGFLARTPQGRILTEKGYRVTGVPSVAETTGQQEIAEFSGMGGLDDFSDLGSLESFELSDEEQAAEEPFLEEDEAALEDGFEDETKR